MRLLLLALPLTLAACDVETRSPTTNDEKVSLKADADGRIAFNLPFAKGEVKLPAEMMRNSNFDIDGVKMIPGGHITGFNLDAQGEGAAKVNLSFEAPVTPAEVRSYFLDQFKEHGVAVAAAGEAISGASKDGTDFVMRFVPDGSGTKGTIELIPERKPAA